MVNPTEPTLDRKPSRAGLSSPHHGDLALTQAAHRGDSKARAEFVERMRCIPRILSAKNRRMGHPLREEDLADLCQETFSTVWSKLQTYEGTAKLETWVARFCLLLFMNSMRRKLRRRHLHLEREPSHPEERERDSRVDLEQIQSAIVESLRQLKPETARIIEWRLLDRQSFEEIASRLGVHLNTIKTRYYRGLERLRARLSPLFKEELS